MRVTRPLWNLLLTSFWNLCKSYSLVTYILRATLNIQLWHDSTHTQNIYIWVSKRNRTRIQWQWAFNYLPYQTPSYLMKFEPTLGEEDVARTWFLLSGLSLLVPKTKKNKIIKYKLNLYKNQFNEYLP